MVRRPEAHLVGETQGRHRAEAPCPPRLENPFGNASLTDRTEWRARKGGRAKGAGRPITAHPTPSLGMFQPRRFLLTAKMAATSSFVGEYAPSW